MDVFFAHTQVRAAASWLASSKTMRHRLRERLLSSESLPPIEFVEVVIEWEEVA
ncbi:MAG: hypothetical protein IPO40_23740 [Fibrobacteres bacterium]|nr:hypothetical protein [Fibrobacterota bacterium]